MNMNAELPDCARIIVLTYNRPRSLLRLLRSLEAAHYTFPTNNPGWQLILEIRWGTEHYHHCMRIRCVY